MGRTISVKVWWPVLEAGKHVTGEVDALHLGRVQRWVRSVFRVDFGCSLRGSGVDLRDFGQFW